MARRGLGVVQVELVYLKIPLAIEVVIVGVYIALVIVVDSVLLARSPQGINSRRFRQLCYL